MTGQTDQLAELLRQLLEGPNANGFLVGMVIALVLALLIICRCGGSG